MSFSRITIFTGHFGSGKTTLAVRCARDLSESGKKVIMVDMDTVNPYFRLKDFESELMDEGISMIASQFANTNIDIPSLPSEIYSVFLDKSAYVILDVGGDGDGATALGRFFSEISAEDYDMIFVLNANRPLTRTAEDCIDMIAEIEAASRLKITTVVNNTHLMELTSPSDIERGREVAAEVAAALEIELRE